MADTGSGDVGSVRAFTLTITPMVCCPTITLPALPPIQMGAAYNQSVAASPAGTYTYAVTSGNFPPGLSLDPNTGAVTGTPTTDGSYSFTITATNPDMCTGSQSYALAGFTKSFYDDTKRSQFCVNTATGAYRWAILKGAGSGGVYTGTLQVKNGGTLFTTAPGGSDSLYLTYDVARSKANGYFYHGSLYSALVDTNTKNDPACGLVGTP